MPKTALISVNPNDFPEAPLLERDEYQLRVLSADYKDGVGKAGPWAFVKVRLVAIGGGNNVDTSYENCEPFYHTQWIPQPGKDKKGAFNRWNYFTLAMGFEEGEGFSPDDLVSREPWGIVGQQDNTYNDNTTRENFVERWIVPAAE